MELDPSVYNTKNYCPAKASGPPCPPRGLFDISQCTLPGDLSPPIYASLPHFVNADPTLRERLEGLRDGDPEKDTIKIAVEPVS